MIAALSVLLPLLLALFPFKLAGLSFFFLIPLFSMVLREETSLKKAVIWSFLAGLAYYGVAFFWISKSLFKLYFINLVLAVWIFPVYFAVVYVVNKKLQRGQALLLSLIFWWVLHTLMTRTSVNAIALDYPYLTSPLAVLQIAKFGGFVIWQMVLIGFQMALVIWWTSKESKYRLVPLILFTGLLVGSFFYGTQKLNAAPESVKPSIALVQHDLPMSTTWRVENKEEIKTLYRNLVTEAKSKNPELIVFPLYTMPEDHFRNTGFFSSLAKEARTPILMATHVPLEAGAETFGADYENYALLFSKEGKRIAEYQAVQKAPEFIRSKEATADEYVVMQTPMGKVGILLCFEDTVPKYARAAKEQGAEFLVALSNPGHFVNTKMPRLYMIYDQLRAIETGLSLFRLSPNGPTVVMDSHGRILKQSQLNESEIIYSR